jgi:hypothetical protein
MAVHHLAHLVPTGYLAHHTGQSRAWDWRQPEDAEVGKADQAEEAGVSAFDEAGAGARRMAMSKVRIAGEPPGPS